METMDWDSDRKRESCEASMSWVDMHQRDEVEEKRSENLNDVVAEEKEDVNLKKIKPSRELRERIRFTNVGRKKDFVCLERIDGRKVNILEGLELHTGVFSAAEQRRIVDAVYNLQEKGRNNEFEEHTYSEPRKWMRGKGRVTIQFGCCYNYAEKNGIPPGIIRRAIADPIPNLFKTMIKRLVHWHVLSPDCVPDSCIVNIYEPGDCIPPHIDSHDFVRPFSTVSFLSECNILFGSNLKAVGPGEFIGSMSVPLPVGSVLVLNGNGADIAKHCVPSVPFKRISITFRKMHKSKRPHGFWLEPDLQNIKPYDANAEIESWEENKEETPAEITEIIRSIGRKLRSEIHRTDSEEPMERPSRHGSMNDYGSNSSGGKAYSVRRLSMRSTHEACKPDIDEESFIKRRYSWDSRHHTRQRIRL
ncbi:uncharacterized protein LOC110031672 [Phalaenopsis equestris]|uniref:uncharacterized protein LOC110031672 n=1 Tax=Phalaenopsis equestris TaxID=78828 RepID=UPI0009E6536C|nr:uncharacterized protein LOC110031672 [Phalaenopsis equestris]